MIEAARGCESSNTELIASMLMNSEDRVAGAEERTAALYGSAIQDLQEENQILKGTCSALEGRICQQELLLGAKEAAHQEQIRVLQSSIDSIRAEVLSLGQQTNERAKAESSSRVTEIKTLTDANSHQIAALKSEFKAQIDELKASTQRQISEVDGSLRAEITALRSRVGVLESRIGIAEAVANAASAQAQNSIQYGTKIGQGQAGGGILGGGTSVEFYRLVPTQHPVHPEWQIHKRA